MKPLLSLASLRSSRKYFLGLLVVFGVLALSACGGGGGKNAQIYDSAHVLNSSKVLNAASQMQNPLAIYTTNTFQGNQADFQRTATAKLGNDPNRIVMAIDAAHHYVYIARGSKVPLSGAGINQAVNSFSSNYNNGNYTNASVAAINSMHQSMRGANTGSSSFSPSLGWCLVPLLLILGGVFFAATRRNRPGRGMFDQGPTSRRPMYTPPDQRRGYPEQFRGQEPYTGPSDQSRKSPWAAGGLGAAAGGIAGYELGKRRGEQPVERDDEIMGGGGQFGGNSEGKSDFGGGGQFGSGNKNAGGELGSGGTFGDDDFTGKF